MSQKKSKAARREGDGDSEELKKALDKLTPQEAEMFVQALELTMRKRRVLLLGYVAAVIALLLGIMFAFWIYGRRDPGQFVGWAFLVPPLVAGVALISFGKLARSLKPRTSSADEPEVPRGADS